MTADHPEKSYFDVRDNATGTILQNVNWINEEAGYIGVLDVNHRRRPKVEIVAVRGDFSLVPKGALTRPSH